jgi:hypothetical protein
MSVRGPCFRAFAGSSCRSSIGTRNGSRAGLPSQMVLARSITRRTPAAFQLLERRHCVVRTVDEAHSITNEPADDHPEDSTEDRSDQDTACKFTHVVPPFCSSVPGWASTSACRSAPAVTAPAPVPGSCWAGLPSQMVSGRSDTLSDTLCLTASPPRRACRAQPVRRARPVHWS